MNDKVCVFHKAPKDICISVSLLPYTCWGDPLLFAKSLHISLLVSNSQHPHLAWHSFKFQKLKVYEAKLFTNLWHNCFFNLSKTYLVYPIWIFDICRWYICYLRSYSRNIWQHYQRSIYFHATPFTFIRIRQLQNSKLRKSLLTIQKSNFISSRISNTFPGLYFLV